jgi:hypothetical protein
MIRLGIVEFPSHLLHACHLERSVWFGQRTIHGVERPLHSARLWFFSEIWFCGSPPSREKRGKDGAPSLIFILATDQRFSEQ